MLERIFRFLAGQNGAEYVTDTGAHNSRYSAITALADTTIAAMTAPAISGNFAGMPIPAGVTIYGQIESFTLTSGKVLAYKL